MVWNTDRGKNIQQATLKQSKNVKKKKKMVNIQNLEDNFAILHYSYASKRSTLFS